MNKPIFRPVIHRTGSALMVALLMMLWPLAAQANPFLPDMKVALETSVTPKLLLNPDQCVALMQGQECYVTVQMRWTGLTKDAYCLYSSQQKQALHCWKNLANGMLKYAFNAKKNIHLSIKQKNSKLVLIRAQVKMAWVYKKKGKPRMSWRMF